LWKGLETDIGLLYTMKDMLSKENSRANRMVVRFSGSRRYRGHAWQGPMRNGAALSPA
jgi:hypothetical protein